MLLGLGLHRLDDETTSTCYFCFPMLLLSMTTAYDEEALSARSNFAILTLDYSQTSNKAI